MSSEQNNNNKKRARRNRASSQDVTSISKKVKTNYDSLTIYNTTNPLNQALVELVQSLYKSRDIRNIKTATNALDILKKENNINKFKTKFVSITKLVSNKAKKKQNNKRLNSKR